MSTPFMTPVVDDSDLETTLTTSPEFHHPNSESLRYAVTHIFLPVHLPNENDYTLEKDLSLAHAVCAAAHAYSAHISGNSECQWKSIVRMLDKFQESVQSEHMDKCCVISQLSGMRTGDTLAFLIRPHNCAIILTKWENCTLFETFEVSPREAAVESAAGPLICSYPGFAVEMPNQMFNDQEFQLELANFLCRSNTIDPPPPSAHAEYIAALLSDILRGAGHIADVPRIVKRLHDDVGRAYYSSTNSVWRRSSLWLLMKVTIQMSVDRSALGRAFYKRFMLFFICTTTKDANISNLSSDLLHLMGSKILRRTSKLGSSIPDWLSQIALKTCAGLREILGFGWSQLSTCSPPFRSPSDDELARDTRFSSFHIRSYQDMRDTLGNQGDEPVGTPFHPSHPRRGTFDDFLSSNGAFFDEAYEADPNVTLHDVEQAVEQNIDDWTACVTNLDGACVQLEILMDRYTQRANYTSAEDISTQVLTNIQLFIALDKLVVEEVSMLADYSPEIPLAFLEGLLFRRSTGLHHLSRAHQYLSSRHSRSRPGWSVLSNEFTENSFAVRYYDRSPHLQQLKARIEEDTLVEGVSQSPLPTLVLQAKVVVFELHCPMYVRVWRSAAARILYYLDSQFFPLNKRAEKNLLAHNSALQRYYVDCDRPSPHAQLHFAYFYPKESQPQSEPTLLYILYYPSVPLTARSYKFRYWHRERLFNNLSFSLYESSCSSCRALADYAISTSHTSNDVLTAQADCPMGLSLDEFIAFGQLRSGGLLQWLNILQGLRSRTLNFRHCHFHYLIALAALQVGPLDVNTGAWIWHQELQDSSFCDTLLDELESLLVDVGAGFIDGMMMNTVSLVLTRVFASSPAEGVSERVVALLRRVGRKTFSWVQELSYNLAKAPMSEERSNLLLEMAATCRSTFDINSAALPRLFQSAEDVDALLSPAFLIRALSWQCTNKNYSYLLKRDRRLSFNLEGTLRDAILMDVSDYGIDLAVSKILPSHKPGSSRWEQLQHPDARWLTCRTKATMVQPSQTVHLNLLDGEIRIDGQPLGGLPRAIWDSLTYREIFRDQGFFVIPSDLPGMDFTTPGLAALSKHKVHFSLRDDKTAVRVQCNYSKDILELIPPGELRALPPVLVDGHVHWLNLSTRIIEIRPLEHIWEQSPDNWRIDCGSGQYYAHKGSETLVDTQSPTWAMVSQCFEYLNTSSGPDNNLKLIATASPVEFHQSAPVLRLSVALPDFVLSFFVNQERELESRDFKNMVYDENQCVGTLIGLKNMLVLRQKSHLVDGFIPRCILVPNGLLKNHPNHQVQVESDRRCSAPLYHTYDVDTELGCLVGNGSLTNTRYLAYLHAVTSCHRPDPLTGKNGAQAALDLLQSAGCRSIMKLKALDDDDRWTSTKYPQINVSHREIRNRYYWDRQPYVNKAIIASEKRAVQRAAYLFPWHTTGPTSLEGCNYDESDYSSVSTFAEPGLFLPNEQTPWQTTLEQLLSDRPVPELPPRNSLLRDSHKGSSSNVVELNQLFSSLSMDKSDSSFQQEYIALLEKSAQHVREDSRMAYVLTGKDHINILEKYYVQCRANYLDALRIIEKTLGPTADPHQQMLDQFGQWPRVTADILLRCLASTSPISISVYWKKCLTSLALLFLDLQRARRLLRFSLDGIEEEFFKELENEGCDGWNPDDYPDWLLIQIQGDFLIRRAQAEIAMEMISPKTGRNTAMQVNMGEGKSTVIIPITAVALADGKQLFRVIVPKALTAQMFELLVARLGGLVNRPIYHLPFSRTTEYGYAGKAISLQIDQLHELMSRCMAERGILLVQPEHVASLKLMTIEEQVRQVKPAAAPLPKLLAVMYKHIATTLSLKSLPEDSYVGSIFRSLSRPLQKDTKWDIQSASDSASKWLKLQMWINSHVRDIMDESDEILHPRFQLIYTMGIQQHIDGYPDRWTIIQELLRLVKRCFGTLARNHTNSIEYEHGPPGSFPHVGIVRSSDIGRRLISLVVEHVMAGWLPNLNFQDAPSKLRDAIRSFISDEDVLQVPGTAKRVEDYAKCSNQGCMWSGLLLLRGLLTSNVLLFALTERRWRVDYGLVSQSQHSNHSSASTMLAVPYRAKDMPVHNTYFGHPDITILLTCLSYYYAGLTEEQLRTSFEVLLDQDDPSTEYARWVKDFDDESLPDSLQTLDGVNLRSSEQWDKVVFPLFSRNQAAVNYYLSWVVFPQEAKEYPWKLSASSWDVAEQRENIITAFSGTNDSRWLLPMSIDQRDFDHQQGTNARALAYILRPENDIYMATHNNGEREVTRDILQIVAEQRPEVRVLLDVGAQILDSSNLQVAETWLDITRDATGAIYFNEDDELMVLNRNVVYVDHAHTMGTDIKLPIGSRAAVTLGPRLTKDRLVQGCMRMRKLGHGHSVMFLAPLEVDLSIRALAAKMDPNVRVTTVDILCWVIHETWIDIQQRAPYWARQGMNHKSRYDAWSRFCNDGLTPSRLSDAWLQPECKSLEDLYAPPENKNAPSTPLDPEIHQRCKDLGVISFPSANMEEEQQQREVNREREREREVELPPKAEPAEHSLHPDIITFVKTGVIPPSNSSSAFRPIFTTLAASSAATLEEDVWSPSILATTDFCTTIKPESTQGTMDQYLRPVQWVLSSKKDQALVLLSPFEAERLLPNVRESERVHLHVYAPRTSLRMKPSDDLKLYSIPPLPSDWTPPWALIDQLNLFAGQLYLRDYPSYLRLCRFLDVPTSDEPQGDTAVPRNLFNIPGSFEEHEIRFSRSPLPSVMALLAIRNRGRPFAQTHMGRILQGQPLREKDFDGPR